MQRKHRRPVLALACRRPPQIVGPIQVARRGDMDMNGHVNNVMYLAWALETVPNDVFHGRHLYQVRCPGRVAWGGSGGACSCVFVYLPACLRRRVAQGGVLMLAPC